MTVNSFNRCWDYIFNGPEQNVAPTKKQHQDFINQRQTSFPKTTTPAQTFSLGGAILFGVGWLFSLRSDNKFAKWSTGILAGIGVAATAIFGLIYRWKFQGNTINTDTHRPQNGQPIDMTQADNNISETQSDSSPTVTPAEQNDAHITSSYSVIARDPVSDVSQEFKMILDSATNLRLLSEDISPKDFYSKGLIPPKYKIELNGYTYYLSEPFTEEKWHRPSFNLYLVTPDPFIENKKCIYARGVYKSNSQAIWRVASHTTEHKRWIGKGHGESTMNLPFQIQSKLEKILENYNWAPESSEDLSRVLAILGYEPPKTCLVPNGVKIGDFKNTDDPTSFVFNDSCKDKAPSFRDVKDVYVSKNYTYGEIRSYIVGSKDGQLHYLFNVATDKNKKLMIWLGGIEFAYNKLTTYGVADKVINVPFNLLMPAYEYTSQIPSGYRGDLNPEDYDYSNATQFTHKIPIIKEFALEVLGIAI